MRRRELRVFVSSTFADMQAERDVLVKHVFPEVRKRCGERGVAFVEVDLRWGISSEAAAEDGVLSICLAEIERCRPFFLGMLGDRYGWVPAAFDDAALERHPWLRNWPDRSITELEIVHGALGDDAGERLACFYFRDLPAGAAAPLDPRLADLKERIRRSGCSVHERYSDPAEFGALVLADLNAYVDRFFPARTAPDALALEAERQASFAESRQTAYVPPQGAFERLDAHAAHDGPPLVVCGAPGSGKSALLANWAEAHRVAFPRDVVLTHFAGSTPESGDLRAILTRLLRELGARSGVGDDVPTDAAELEAAFAVRLGRAAAALQLRAGAGEVRTPRVVLVLDGIDVVRNHDGIVDVTWLPVTATADASLVLAASPGDVLDALERRGCATLRLEPLTEDERRRAAVAYLALFAKVLSPALLAKLTAAPQTGSPLFLRALLGEMRVYGDHETLGHRLDTYLTARDATALYERILARYETDYETLRPRLVRDALSLVWSARDGLTEPELLALLGEPGAPLPRGAWAPLGLAIEDGLISRGGLLSFFHDTLRDAVERRYLLDPHAKLAVHVALAAFFGSAGAAVTERRLLRELPWQLARAEAWTRLGELIGYPAFLIAAWETDRHDLLRFAGELQSAGGIRVAALFAPMTEQPASFAPIALAAAAKVLARGFDVEGAALLQEHLIERSRADGNLQGLAASLNDRALTVAESGDLPRALALHAEQSDVARRSGDREAEAAALVNEARLLVMRGDNAAALARLAAAEPLARDTGNARALRMILGQRGELLKLRGDLAGARALYEELERSARRGGDTADLIEALIALAQVAVAVHDLERAEILLDEGERLAQTTGDRLYAAQLQLIRGRIAYDRDDFDGALAAYDAADATSAAIGVTRLRAQIHVNRGAILLARGRNDEAIRAFAALEAIARENGDAKLLAAALGNQGAGWLGVGANGRARTLFEAQAAIARELDDYAGLRSALNNLRLAAARSGRREIAQRALDEELELCRSRGDHEAYAELRREFRGAS
jgi:tetratricopeptide (TPR) repeat protein